MTARDEAMRAPAALPIWREQRWPVERARLLADPVWWGMGVPRGTGEPVLLIPGLMAGDWTLTLMAQWLKRIGYRPAPSGMRFNAGCSGATVERLAPRVREIAEEHGRPVTLIGQSRGGLLARAVAVREPDAVLGAIALGSPVLDQFAAHPLVVNSARAVAQLGDRGIGNLFSGACAEGECCARFRDELSGPWPADVRYVCVYSRSDGIVPWQNCLDPAAEHAEVSASHVGMNAERSTYRAIARALHAFRTGASAV